MINVGRRAHSRPQDAKNIVAEYLAQLRGMIRYIFLKVGLPYDFRLIRHLPFCHHAERKKKKSN